MPKSSPSRVTVSDFSVHVNDIPNPKLEVPQGHHFDLGDESTWGAIKVEQRPIEPYTVNNPKMFKIARLLHGARICDPRNGVTYECVAERREGGAVLVRKTVIPHGANTVDNVTQMSDAALAVLTVSHVERGMGMNMHFPRPTVENPDCENHDQPSLHEVARQAATAIEKGESARGTLRDLHGVSVATADIWLRRARDAGLLPERRPGRPRTTTPKLTNS